MSLRSVRGQHVRENLGALGFELPRTEMQLISGRQAELPYPVLGCSHVSRLNSAAESRRA